MPAFALYQPDIPQNVGSMVRLAACLSVPLHIIEPCGFVFDDKRLKRVAMDYMDLARLHRHLSWTAFSNWRGQRRVILLSTKAAVPYTEFPFQGEDILLLGQESAGVPEEVHRSADARVLVPMNPKARSLNVALTAAMVLGEAIRQMKHGQ